MSQPLTIENDCFIVRLWPGFGGKITSIVDKADRHELLWTYPAELPTAAMYDVPYGQGWYAGWDECFPSVAASRYVGRPYEGIAVPDHGELWGLPTQTTPSRNGAVTTWQGLRFGYTLQRQLSLEGHTLQADYTLHNHAPLEFRFVWAQHALMPLTEEVQLDLDVSGFRLSHDAQGGDIQQPLAEAQPATAAAAGRPATLPSGQGWKLCGVEPIARPAVIRFGNRSRTLSIGYTSPDAVDAYWGIWINTGGWAGHRHFAVEPTTGRFDQIDRCIHDRSAGRVGPGGLCRWQTRWTVGT